MTHTVTFHAIRGGSGSTTLAVESAKLVASSGRRVGLVDLNLPAPHLHKIFGIAQNQFVFAINDVFQREASLDEAVVSVPMGDGSIELLLADGSLEALARNLRDAERPTPLNQLLERFSAEHSLDLLILDTGSGLTREAVIGIAAAQTVFFVSNSGQIDAEDVKLAKLLVERVCDAKIVFAVNRVKTEQPPACVDEEAVVMIWDSAETEHNSVELPTGLVNRMLANVEQDNASELATSYATT